MHSRVPSLILVTVLTACACACGGDGDPADEDTGGDVAMRPAHDGEWELGVDQTPDGAFMSVWGTAADDVWAVGGQTSVGDRDGDGVVYRYLGQDWERVDVPPGPMLNWVYGVDGQIWIVGEAGRSLRFSDEAFEQIDTGVAVTLWGAWGASSSDIWAVGGDPLARDPAPVLVHFDGEAWAVADVPALDRDGVKAFFKVWGTASDDVWAVGSAGVIVHWDGTAWTQHPTDIQDDLISLWGRSSTEIITVGGRATGVVGRWDGDGWQFERLDRVSGLNGSWMARDGTAWVVGTSGRILRFDAGAFTFEDESSPTNDMLHAVFSLDGGPGYAVGGTLLAPPPFVGDILVAR